MRVGLRAFTLAEVMIVLAVIGILTAILLPVAHNSTPNENILKFKKAHNTLHAAIRELVNSDEYYLNGDLSIKANGDLVDSDIYFCSTLAQIINTKISNCAYATTYTDTGAPQVVGTIEPIYSLVDIQCDYVEDNNRILQTYFIGQDGVYFIDNNGYYHFGKIEFKRISIVDNFEQYDTYKTFCIDIDGFNQGEKPFGYGIRVDGKIIAGLKAQQWLEKSIQEK